LFQPFYSSPATDFSAGPIFLWSMMMSSSLSALLPTEHILLDVALDNKNALFEYIASLCKTLHGLDPVTVKNCLLEREKLASTGIGLGVAIPHGRPKKAKKPLVFLIRLAKGIEFESIDKQPVTLVMCFVIPENANQLHLDLLANTADLISNKKLRNLLETEKSPDTIRQHILQWGK
jgi:nitrogen PTS system EIIA component